ncbi:DUF3160 domain-containing protein [Chloroflexia bacterium SDU3-3]|nr:DUF3160 domain-containing protein [Chloroflexia bacterium SDU3-3]
MRRRAPLYLLGVVLLAACQMQSAATPPTATPSASAAPTTLAAPAGRLSIAPVDAAIPASFKATSGHFALFQVAAVAKAAALPALSPAPDLSNVAVTALLTPEQRSMVALQGFTISPADTKEFYEVYERARYSYAPAFVTSDSILHVYHLMFDKMLRTTESQYLADMLTRLDWELMRASTQQYEQLRGTPLEQPARRNAAYFAVAVHLLQPEWSIPEALRDLAQPDLDQIAAHSGFAPSAIFPDLPNGEDWSQYVPRGHYTASEKLARYFTAMMWHGRMAMSTSSDTASQQAALLAMAMRDTTIGSYQAADVWSGIYEPTVFFVGKSDDLTPPEYIDLLEKTFGAGAAPSALLDTAKLAQLRDQAAALHPPQVNTSQGAGLRFMGQRLVPDAYVFDQLIAPHVEGRSLPKALDLFAAIGSERASQHLASAGDSAMPGYQDQIAKLQSTFQGYNQDTWTQNLYWSWIYSLRPMLEKPGDEMPFFMRSQAWQDKQLNAAIASWSQLKRDTILYSKQAYAEGAWLPPPSPDLPKGYVEPVPELYARIGAMTTMLKEGLDSRGLLDDDGRTLLENMQRVVATLKSIAEKELTGVTPTEDEYQFIRRYGVEIEALTLSAHDDENAYVGPQENGSSEIPPEVATVADVATNPGGSVLEEGVGRVFNIYVAVPVEGKLVLAQGGVFSHYEFEQPLGERLTDEAWKKRLEAGDVPPLADWTASFLVAQTADQQLSDTILNFNTALVNAFWNTNASQVESYLGPDELADTKAFIQGLVDDKTFLGMKRHSIDFRSFDMQDASHATVATRERWSEKLYPGSVSDLPPDEGSLPKPIGVRDAYDSDVTYTMEKQGDSWIITKIVTKADLPPLQKP